MRRARVPGQLSLDLEHVPMLLPVPAIPQEAVQALAEMLLEALEGRGEASRTEGGDDPEDHH